ncbi:MAG: hypothetical protein ACI4UE_05150 [Candidatus Scatovivens sp.]
MNFLIGIIFFIIGFTLGVFTRNILIKFIKINNKIKEAERIIAEEKRRRDFREKYDFFGEDKTNGQDNK